MIIVDSFGWIEWLTEGALADKYAEYLCSSNEVITPVVILYEVYKKSKQTLNEESALRIVARLQETKVVPITPDLAVFAADVSLRHRLPMADALVYATALSEKCSVVTSDPHFEGLEKVIFIEEEEGSARKTLG